MVREIVTDTEFLSMRSEPASRSDRTAARDLLDTLKAHSEKCVGMAANMIGVNKRIIAIAAGKSYIVMINPVIVSYSGEKESCTEGCLSLEGVRRTERYPAVTVEYLDMNFKKKKQSFSGLTAQIIQHETDHFEGKLI